MRLEVNITKKSTFIFLGAILLIAGFAFVIAVAPNPGHDPAEIGPGTFGTDDSSYWFMKGNLQISTIRDAALILKDTDTTSLFSYIDWRDEDDTRLFWVGMHNDGSFRIWNTVLQKGINLKSNGDVEVEKLIVTGILDSSVVDAGTVEAGKVCINGVCRDGWYKNNSATSITLDSNDVGNFEETTIGIGDDFCALQNVQIGGGATYQQAGCQLYDFDYFGDGKPAVILRAFREDHSQIVYCRAKCIKGITNYFGN